MTNVKKRLILIMIALLFIFSGCVSRSPYYNDLDTRMFYANMKPSLENYGKKAAVYDNRIYYLSTEKGFSRHLQYAVGRYGCETGV